jgi:hypothetical protein
MKTELLERELPKGADLAVTRACREAERRLSHWVDPLR